MNADHSRMSEWDGAYVLGALSAADRAEYEGHLAICAECRTAVAELAPTAGLLSRLSADRARAIDASSGPVPIALPHPSLRTRVVQTARRRRARRITAWTLAASLAVVAVGVPTVVTIANASSSSGTTYALDEVGGAPLEASVKLTPVAWGTRIDLVCQYTGEVLDAPPGGWPYALAVTDDSGSTSVLSTWRAGPGATTELSAGTDLEASSIGSIEIRSVDGDRVVMRRDFSTP
ncbi:anti-sigma factor family protein [Microbacterium testaceum]|uniref:anti-sigma factor family protein n=2 Tax=Microbacterium testaceum TaxID=2033 RepID=UPI0007341460|nr:zf-HC2 domain-containing protein [Microbacterium testaceum]